MILQLNKIMVPVKNLQIILRNGVSRFHIIFQQGLDNLAGQAGRKTNQALAVLTQDFPVNTRLVVKALQIGHCVQFAQITIALLIFRQQHQVISAFVLLALLEKARARSHVKLAANDGLNARQPLSLALLAYLFTFLVKLQHAKHIAVVGNGHRGHAQISAFGNQLLNTRRSVQQGIFTVIM